MSIKLNVGTSKKIGLPDYGSAGSQCNLEIELDSSALDRPDEFHRRVREAYAACRAAVEDELANHRSNNGAADTRPTTPPKTEYRNSAPPERNDNRSNDNRFPVSPKQLSFINQLMKAVKGLTARKLDDYCQATYGMTCKQLSSKDASRLIDDLKQAKDGGKDGLA